MRNLIFALLSAVIFFVITVYGVGAMLSNDPQETADKKDLSVEKKASEEAAPTIAEFLASYDDWYSYSKKNIDLMSTFQALDENGGNIGRGIFLNLLRTGAYAPKKEERAGDILYRLVPIHKTADKKIKDSIRSLAKNAYHYFKIEGKKMPAYDFVDLNGVAYNQEDTEGKILVLKCWFIRCKVCVEEFPELNKLVAKYQNKNVAFVSLAFDEKDKLDTFLKSKTFSYATIPSQKEYMAKKLKVKQYPTHIIVDEDGTILKMVNNVHTLASELARVVRNKR